MNAWRKIHFLDGLNFALMATGVLMRYMSNDKLASVLVLSASIALTAVLAVSASRAKRHQQEHVRRRTLQQHAFCIYKGGLSDPRNK
jgi:hypothetical protein